MLVSSRRPNLQKSLLRKAILIMGSSYQEGRILHIRLGKHIIVGKYMEQMQIFSGQSAGLKQMGRSYMI
jgi:hypothetical protein